MTNYNYLTQGGYEKLKAELEELKTTGRQEVARAIAEAREKGDLSENAEYDAAKEAQGLLELKISKLEDLIANARLMDKSDVDVSKVMVMSTVKLKNLKTNQIVSYTLVSETEANLKLGKISINSPIGQGLVGKRVGEKVAIKVPAGTLEFEILEISVE